MSSEIIQNESLYSDLEKIRNNNLINLTIITIIENYFDANNKLKIINMNNFEIDNIINLNPRLLNLQNKFI